MDPREAEEIAMGMETTLPQSRRALLAAGIGGLVAALAAALGRPLAVRAANGETLTAGNTFTASATTGVSTDTGNGLQGVFNGITYDAVGVGVFGESTNSYNAIGVHGRNMQGYGLGILGEAGDYSVGVQGTGGTGVYGYSTRGFGTGVNGRATGVNGTGVSARSEAAGGKALFAYADNGIAVDAEAFLSTTPVVRAFGHGDAPAVQGSSGAVAAAPPRVGVYGYAAQGADARGVTGESTVGRGVNGIATTGVGGYFSATSGTALRAEGAVRFKTSGLATIAEGARSVTVTPVGLDVTTSSKILALLQGDAGGSTTVQRVAVNATANTFTIYLTANSVRAVKVSWFVIS
jgi:hypothetical protein